MGIKLENKIDIQLHQLINLGLILLIGKYVAHIYLPWENILFILLAAILMDHLFIYYKNRYISFFSFSSSSTAIGVMLMMVTPHIWITVIVIFLSLFQKHFLQYEKLHFFNPSNFALIAGLLLFYDDAHIVLGQMGDSVWLGSAVSVLGIVVLYRVDRWLIPLSFSIVYLLLQYIIIVCSDPVLVMEEVYYRFYSVSFIIFVLFMLTDPRTTPDGYWYQGAFASVLALGATGMDYWYGFRVQHLFMVLFILSATVPLINSWDTILNKKQLILITLILILLSISVIIHIQMNPPYYLEMDG